MRIWIDPGHGGSDFGAISSGLVEKEMNLEVALELMRILKLSGFEVGISRDVDKFVSLSDRCKMANSFKADLFISIHHNAGGGDRGEVIYSVNDEKSKQFALLVAEEFKKIGQNIVKVFSRKNILGKDYYYVLRNTNMPSVITEFCFIDSEDRKIADTKEEQQSEGRAIAVAVGKLYGIEITSDYIELKRILKLTNPYMRGEDIKLLQNKLIQKGYDVGAADGIFGKKTEEAVKKFQTDNSLTADGIVGLKTWKKLYDL